MSNFIGVFSGVVAAMYFIAGIFFLKFWRRAKDSLFLSFSVGFFLFATNQALVGAYGRGAETSELSYSLRLIGFLLIIMAIVLKNIRTPR